MALLGCRDGTTPTDGGAAGAPCVDQQAEDDSISGHAHGAFGDCAESAQNSDRAGKPARVSARTGPPRPRA